MSSSLDVGLLAEEARKRENCNKSPNGKHKWKITCGMWPSVEKTCKYCKQRIYTK
mgnify:CR=1 FL=1